MQNQENKIFDNKLSKLRDDIDKIDSKILDLLEKRFDIVNHVKELKDDHADKFYIKSARESDMIKSLIAKSDGKVSASLIVDIWRKIISFANSSEQPINIALHNPNKISDFQNIIQLYYNSQIPVTRHDSVSSVIMDLESGKSQIAIFLLPRNKGDNIDNNWWIDLANNTSGIKVFATIPVIENSTKYDLVALAIKEVEKSNDDNTLLCIEISNKVSEKSLINDLSSNFENFKILKSAKSDKVENTCFYLVEIKGFLDEKDESLKSLNACDSKPYIKILGIYPTQIIV